MVAIQAAALVGCMAWQAGSRLAAEAHTGHPVLPSFLGYLSAEPVSWHLSQWEGEASVHFPAAVVARGNLGEVGSRWSLPQGGVAQAEVLHQGHPAEVCWLEHYR